MEQFVARDFTGFIQSPLNQLLVFFCIWLANYVVKWRNEEYIIYSGFVVFASWEVIAAVVSISDSVQWMYYIHLAGMLLAAYLVYILSIAISDKLGNSYSGEGAIAILAPIFIFPVLMGPAALVKLVVQWFS